LRSRTLLVARVVGVILLAGGGATTIEAGQRQPVPRSGGGGHHATAPAYHGGSPPGTATARAHSIPRATGPGRGYPAPHGTANGIARYGYGYGYGGAYYGYPYWGAGYAWWGAGWYGDWWWPGYGYAAYGPWYGPWYGPYYDTYVVPVEAPEPSGPAIVETGVTPQKASVVLDGDAVGFASDYNGRWDKLSVAPGPHTIAFQMKGYRTLVIAFEASPHATYAFNDALVPGEGEDRRTLAAAAAPPPDRQQPPPSSLAIGRLRVQAEPADAAVYLDGEYLGLGAELGRIHAALAVPAGAHRLEAVRPGYVSASRAVEVGETDVVSVVLTLQPAP